MIETGISSTTNIYEKRSSTGVVRKYAESENQNATPPVEKVVPKWVYELVRISNSKPVLTAIALKPPKSIEVSTHPDGQFVKLLYTDSEYLGTDSYTWNYVDDYEIYQVKQARGKLVYVLWHNIVDEEWYVTYCYSFG
jgi:hypothetical protein